MGNKVSADAGSSLGWNDSYDYHIYNNTTLYGKKYYERLSKSLKNLYINISFWKGELI